MRTQLEIDELVYSFKQGMAQLGQQYVNKLQKNLTSDSQFTVMTYANLLIWAVENPASTLRQRNSLVDEFLTLNIKKNPRCLPVVPKSCFC